MIELVTENKKGEKKIETINITEFMDVKGWKTLGNRLSQEVVKKVKLISEKVGEFEPVVVEDEFNAEEDENQDSGQDHKPTPPPPPPPIIKGDSPQLDLL